uniref:Uncharacterized protein n=1 Tax=Arundo donax TaxID=35708 RepID=A0A0A8Z2U2_ARUDO
MGLDLQKVSEFSWSTEGPSRFSLKSMYKWLMRNILGSSFNHIWKP